MPVERTAYTNAPSIRASCEATAARHRRRAGAGIVCNGWREVVETVSAVLTHPQYPKSFPGRYPNLAAKLILFATKFVARPPRRKPSQGVCNKTTSRGRQIDATMLRGG